MDKQFGDMDITNIKKSIIVGAEYMTGDSKMWKKVETCEVLKEGTSVRAGIKGVIDLFLTIY